jgi:hypothetical protein
VIEAKFSIFALNSLPGTSRDISLNLDQFALRHTKTSSFLACVTFGRNSTADCASLLKQLWVQCRDGQPTQMFVGSIEIFVGLGKFLVISVAYSMS